jgi:hypothetical protein
MTMSWIAARLLIYIRVQDLGKCHQDFPFDRQWCLWNTEVEEHTTTMRTDSEEVSVNSTLVTHVVQLHRRRDIK